MSESANTPDIDSNAFGLAALSAQPVAVLLNPLSGRVKRDLPALRRLLAGADNVLVKEAVTPQQIDAALAGFLQQGAALLVVLGGDGTLHALMSAVGRRAAGHWLPMLVIPGGTTNMSAAGLGARLSPRKAIKALLAWRAGTGAAPHTVAQRVLRVRNGEQTLHGFFFGTGAIESGVSYFHQNLRPTGIQGIVGPGLAFARILLALLRGKPHPLLPARAFSVHTDEQHWQRDWLLVLASPLDRLLLGCRPYWGNGSGALHVTAVEYGPRHLPRVLPALLRGRGAGVAHAEDGYLSSNSNQLTLLTPGDFIIDGESIAGHANVQLDSTPAKIFLVF